MKKLMIFMQKLKYIKLQFIKLYNIYLMTRIISEGQDIRNIEQKLY